jgi:hypothetical protein
MHGFGRSAGMLSACTLSVALLLLPFALARSGSGGLAGLVFAAAICLVSGLIAELIAWSIARTSPVSAALLGMMVRMFAPLGACVALLATGQNGREHLPFIGYLLVFYMVTLGLETWLAVKRSSGPPKIN